MYRCEVSGRVSNPGQNRRLWPIYRTNGTISREMTVCDEVFTQLTAGIPLAIVQRTFRPLNQKKVETLVEEMTEKMLPPVVNQPVVIGNPVALKIGTLVPNRKPRKQSKKKG